MADLDQMVRRLENGTFGNWTENISDPCRPLCALGICLPTILGVVTKDGRIFLAGFSAMGDFEDHDDLMRQHGIRDTEFARLHESFTRFWISEDGRGGFDFLCRNPPWPSWWDQEVVLSRLREIGGTEEHARVARRMAVEMPERAEELEYWATAVVVRAAAKALALAARCGGLHDGGSYSIEEETERE